MKVSTLWAKIGVIGGFLEVDVFWRSFVVFSQYFIGHQKTMKDCQDINCQKTIYKATFCLTACILTDYSFISDSFVNSQEWTLSRGVPDIRLGIVGSLSSGKSALVHRYLTGSYMQEESPEGGRFKKEIVVDGQSYLLLIRDEGGPPELQVSQSEINISSLAESLWLRQFLADSRFFFSWFWFN